MPMMLHNDPFAMLNRLHEELARAMGSSRQLWGEEARETTVADWQPLVDIREEPDRFLLMADVPGVKAGDVEVTLEGGILRIQGERKMEAFQSEGGRYGRQERPSGRFYRQFLLPESANPDDVSARVHDGILEVTIGKRAEKQPRRIEVLH
jgi:HSP20 family protein